MMTEETVSARPRVPSLDHDLAGALAGTAYDRLLDLLEALSAEEWSRPTDCPGWDVRAMAGHVVGMARMASGLRETLRQDKLAQRRGGTYIDALTALQVEEQADLSQRELLDRFAEVGPRAARTRQRMPRLVRRLPMRLPQDVGGRPERWTNGYLTDVILTRDTWMHRIDVCRATGREPLLTADHDARIVADVVGEWADRHGRPFTLELTGPAGGRWSRGAAGHPITVDAVEFCRVLSGRRSDDVTIDDLFGTFVPF